jgi:hypothetical protein
VVVRLNGGGTAEAAGGWRAESEGQRPGHEAGGTGECEVVDDDLHDRRAELE